MDENQERMQILEMIDRGKISAAEGLRLLQALADGEQLPEEVVSSPTELSNGEPVPASSSDEPSVEVTNAAVPATATGKLPAQVVPTSQAVQSEDAAPAEGEMIGNPPPDNTPFRPSKWANWWMVPLWIGVGIAVTGAVLMYGALRSSGLGFWFVCAGAPFILGVVVMALAWQSRNAPWLHLRVQQRPGARPQHINLSLPLPLQMTAWFFRTFGSRIKGLQETSLDEIIFAVGEKTSPDTPLHIEVDEGEDGEKVELYIG